ncbi:unnamed protein product [Acanthoscelides obtectus]|nr:unnamed protein product [Acanthoscelides obtectus]CAK1625204.1 hypothetical protein AOBTE_LOCUS3029 [Acanthoscelides obtectus]
MEPRSKRGVINLYNMISCATGCRPLIYKGYGCYCGFLGSGYPVDGIDRCCQLHDSCYGWAQCTIPFMDYVLPYFWQCIYDQPYCAIDHDIFGGPDSCASKLCECDRQLSLCLQQYPCPQVRPFCTSSPFRFFQNAIMMFV